MKAQYEIYEANLAGLQKRIAKLSERSVKLGGTPIMVEVLGHRDVEDTEHKGRMIRLVDITVDGEMPKYAGWSFVATLDHTVEGNVIRAVPGFTVDPKFRDGMPCCDHCKTNRNRRDTYIVRHEDGREMQVGSSCMKDFLGHADPHALTTLAEVWFHVFDLCRSKGGTGMNDIYRISLPEYLEWVASVVLKDRRYVTRKVQMAGGPVATATVAYDAMFGLAECKHVTLHQDYLPSDEAKKLAQAARQFVIAKFAPALAEDGDDAALTASLLNHFSVNTHISDFEHNLLTCARTEAIEPRLCGIAAYIIQYYLLAQPAPKPAGPAVLDEGVRRIFTMFEKAKAGLKRPAIRLMDAEGHRLHLSLAKATSTNAGFVYVKASADYEADYYGKISPEGRFFAVQTCPPTVEAQLRAFAAAPEDIAAHYGKLTGCCCFCGRNLTDDRSTHVGYGLICAEKFGLAWGERAEAAA